MSQPYVYYAFVVGTLLIAGIVSIRLRQMLQIRLAAAAVALGIIYFSTFYLSPVNPSAGYTIISPTEPTGLNRGLRFSQSLADVRPCRYTLLGWGDGHSSLYYSEQCDLFDDGPKQIKMYEMELGIPIVYDRPEAEVVREAYVKEAPDVIDKFDFSAESLENNWAQLHFVSDGLLSANQQHIAVVVKHLAYGPQEIVILTKQ